MLKVISPIDNSVYAERPLAKAAEVDAALDRARKAQRAWRSAINPRRGPTPINGWPGGDSSR